MVRALPSASPVRPSWPRGRRGEGGGAPRLAQSSTTLGFFRGQMGRMKRRPVRFAGLWQAWEGAGERPRRGGSLTPNPSPKEGEGLGVRERRKKWRRGAIKPLSRVAEAPRADRVRSGRDQPEPLRPAPRLPVRGRRPQPRSRHSTPPDARPHHSRRLRSRGSLEVALAGPPARRRPGFASTVRRRPGSANRSSGPPRPRDGVSGKGMIRPDPLERRLVTHGGSPPLAVGCADCADRTCPLRGFYSPLGPSRKPRPPRFLPLSGCFRREAVLDSARRRPHRAPFTRTLARSRAPGRPASPPPPPAGTTTPERTAPAAPSAGPGAASRIRSPWPQSAALAHQRANSTLGEPGPSDGRAQHFATAGRATRDRLSAKSSPPSPASSSRSGVSAWFGGAFFLIGKQTL